VGLKVGGESQSNPIQSNPIQSNPIQSNPIIQANALNLFESRALYFASAEGFADFWERVEASKKAVSARTPVKVFDGEIPGPWSRYATVWRVVFKPETRRFLEDGKSYCFW
jgi:hypothetical protein